MDSALDNPAVGSDLGENESACEFALCSALDASNAAENDIIFPVESSASESLPSGSGIDAAMRSDSYTDASENLRDVRPAAFLGPLRGSWPMEGGGSAACAARLRLEPRLGDVTRGEEARRLEVDASATEDGGEAARGEAGGLLLGYLIGTLVRALPFDAVRNFGDDEETGERACGDKDRVAPLGDKGGEEVDFVGGDNALALCEVDVAWCLREGGAAAIAFALARLAAIAAATLFFLAVVGVTGAEAADA